MLSDGVAFYRLALPAIPDPLRASHEGTWYVALSLRQRPHSSWAASRGPAAAAGSGLPYDVLIHCYSNLHLHAQAVQSGFAPGDDVRVIARLREYDVPVGATTAVWAEIEQPGGGQYTLPLALGPGDQHAAQFATAAPGVYRIRVRARGETFYGNLFTREQTVTAVAVPGGGTSPEPPRASDTDDLVDLLCCLLRGKAIAPDAWKRVEALGIDAAVLRHCLTTLCRKRADTRQDAVVPH